MNALTQMRWRRSPALQRISRLNEMTIEILVDLARRPEAPPVGYSIVTPVRERLRRLDAQSRRRLAEFPILLADLCLTDEMIWAQALRPARSTFESRRRSPHESQSVALARGVTLLTWHVAHSNTSDGAVHFGMSHGVADLLRRADVLELDNAATRLAHHCRPRWHDRPSVWLYLLTRSDTAPAPTRDQTVYALQLLGSDLLTPPAERALKRPHVTER